MRTEWRRPRPPCCAGARNCHPPMIDRVGSSLKTGGVLSRDGCEQKAAAEMVAKTGAKGKFNNGCPSFLQMLADSYGRISPFSDHDRCLSSPGSFSLAGTRQWAPQKDIPNVPHLAWKKPSPRWCPSSVKSVVICPFFSLFQQVCPPLGM